MGGCPCRLSGALGPSRRTPGNAWSSHGAEEGQGSSQGGRVECREEESWKATTPRPEVCPGSAWGGVWGVLTALGLRLVQSRGQCVGLAPEDSGWVWRSMRAALWAVGP